MVLSKPIVFAIGVVLAVIEAVQQIIPGLGQWHTLISAVIVFCGVLGVQAATPAQIAAKIPLHIATLIGAVLAAIEVFQRIDVGMPKVVHIIISVIVVLAGVVGVRVSGLFTTRSAARELAHSGQSVAVQ